MPSAPSAEIIQQYLDAPVVTVTRRVDIYEADGTTPWMLAAPVRSGSVSVDISRQERRTFDLELDNKDNALAHYPGGFWYDKIIRIYRGFKWDQGQTYGEAVLAHGPAGYWNFDGGSGVNEGAIGGSMTFTGGVTLDTGMSGDAVVFDGTTGWAEQDIGVSVNDAFTLSVWARRDTSASDFYRIVTIGSTSLTDWAVLFSTDNRIQFLGIKTDGTQSAIASAVDLVTEGRWYHIVARWDGTTMKLWVDDQVIGETVPSLAIRDSGNVVRVGRGTAALPANGLPGAADELVLWTRMLLDDEVALHRSEAIGVRGRSEHSWEAQQGEFMIDSISSSSGSSAVRCTGRDLTKKCITSKFAYATSFSEGQPVESVIQTIALNAGITRFVFPASGKTLGRTFTFERGTERWAAMHDIAIAYGFELFFNNLGELVMREPPDPVTAPIVFTFSTGPGGSLATFSKSTSDARIYNHIVAVGERQDQLPITAEALNTEPTSPTRIEKLGDRVYQYVSSFISTQEQAQDVADRFLKIHALEQFEIAMGSLVLPWLEAGDIVGFDDPNPSPGDPFRFLLTNFDVPLVIGPMNLTSKRVTIVG